jgi:hypothetical protein
MKKPKIVKEKPLGNGHYLITIELFPESQAEAQILERVRNIEGSEQEKDFFESYVRSFSSMYSIVSGEWVAKNMYLVTAFRG